MNSYADVTTLKSDAYLRISTTDEDVYLRKLLEQSSRLIDWWTHRYFYTREDTLYFDGSTDPLRIGDILSITTLKTDDNADATFENSYTEDTDYRLYPLNEFPKTEARIINGSSYAGYASGVDKGIEITGVFGYGDNTDATPYIDSGDAVADNPSQSATATTLNVTAGTAFAIGQTVRVGSEQEYITAIATNALTVERAMNGTTGAIHLKDVTIYIMRYPRTITQACLITSMRAWKRKDSAYQDVVGGGPLGTVITSKGIDPDVAETIMQYKVWKL